MNIYATNLTESADKIDTNDSDTERNSNQRTRFQLRVANIPGHRMRHIIKNVEKITNNYLKGCPNEQKISRRWQRFVSKWENEISNSPVFRKEFENEKNYLQRNAGLGKPCGRIFREYGLHGQFMELRDAAVDSDNGFNQLSETDFGDNELMSMQPYEG